MTDPSQEACPDLTAPASERKLQLSSPENVVNTTINVTCSLQGHSLVGESQLTCLPSGHWSAFLPYCSGSDELSEREKIIIGISSAVIAVILLILIVVAVCYYRTKSRTKQKRNERLAATLERLSIRDPLDELVRRESRRSSYGNAAFTTSSLGETDTDKRQGEQRSGVQLSRQTLSTWHYPGGGRPTKPLYGSPRLHADSGRNGIKLLKLYKIWDYTRTKKQFVFAEGLEELVQKGGEKLNMSGPIRVVLEEDGTEIDNDAVLRACAGMVFLLLEQNQVWSKPELVLSVHEYSNDLNHYRYDIDEKL